MYCNYLLSFWLEMVDYLHTEAYVRNSLMRFFFATVGLDVSFATGANRGPYLQLPSNVVLT